MAIAEMPLSTRLAQLTDTVLMISPDSFGFNDQTASTNAFQNNLPADSKDKPRNKALSEFHDSVDLLRRNGIRVAICPSKTNVATLDAVFPNNWISFHNEVKGINTVLYPMLAPNRRVERQLDAVEQTLGITIDPSTVLDLTHYEKLGHFLEGTGSLIFDRKRKVVFAHESARTSFRVLDDFCDQTGYRPVKFHAQDEGGKPIYHTNVVMSIGEGFSVVCLEAVQDRRERSAVKGALSELDLEIINITLDQLHAFCGNILEVQSVSKENKIIMSIIAFGAFTEDQRKKLMSYGDIILFNIPTIETIGGGSARCMLAEVFHKEEQTK